MIKKFVLLTVFLVLIFFTGLVSARRFDPQIRQYVYTIRPIACGAQITADDVVLRSPMRHTDIIPFSGFHSVDDVVGQYMDVHISAREPLIAVYLVSTPSQLRHC